MTAVSTCMVTMLISHAAPLPTKPLDLRPPKNGDIYVIDTHGRLSRFGTLGLGVDLLPADAMSRDCPLPAIGILLGPAVPRLCLADC